MTNDREFSGPFYGCSTFNIDSSVEMMRFCELIAAGVMSCQSPSEMHSPTRTSPVSNGARSALNRARSASMRRRQDSHDGFVMVSHMKTPGCFSAVIT
jgi:hypothetical protein